MLNRLAVSILAVSIFIFSFQLFGQDTRKLRFRSSDVSMKSPGNFVENVGQFKNRQDILFMYAENGFKMILTRTGFSYEMTQIAPQTFSESGEVLASTTSGVADEQKMMEVKGHRVDVHLIGINPDFEIQNEQEAKVCRNYYLTGNSPEEYLLVKSFDKITYKDVYPHIDLVFTFYKEQPQYDFVLHPGADLEKIRLSFEGANQIHQATQNELVITTSIGAITEKIPKSFQWIETNASIKQMEASFQLKNGIVSFHAVRNNQSLALAEKDMPGLQWSTYYGGTETESYQGLAIDKNSNVIAYGMTYSAGNIATPGAFLTVYNGEDYGSSFFSKFDSSGALLWSTYYLSSPKERSFIRGIEADTSNEIYISGFATLDGMATPGSFLEHPLSNLGDGFLVKFDASGQRLWGTYYGGASADNAWGVTVDCNTNEVILCGSTSSLSGIATADAYQTNLHRYGTIASDGFDAYLVKFDAMGNREWATYFGGRKNDQAIELSCDSHSNIILFGNTQSLDSIASPGAFQAAFGGYTDNFVVKWDATGNVLWSTYYGGGSEEQGYGSSIKVDQDDHIIFGGTTRSVNQIASPGAHKEYLNDYIDGYLAKLDPSGTRLWATYYGGSSYEVISCIDLDDRNNIYLSGYTESSIGISTPNSFKPNLSNNDDAFLSKFSPDGELLWGSYFGDEENDFASAIVIDREYNIFIAGLTMNGQGIATPQAYDTVFNDVGVGSSDAFLSKFSPVCIAHPLEVYPLDKRGFCKEDSLLLHTAPATNYYWSNGKRSNAIYIKQPGNYALTVEDTSGCFAFSDRIKVTAFSAPSFTIHVSDPLEFCTGDSVQLEVLAPYTLLWSTGSASPAIIVKQSGTVSMEATDSNHCKASDSVTVVVNPLPLPVLSAADTSLCEGQSVFLKCPGFINYTWSEGSVSDSIAIDHAGNYFVRVVDVNGCSNQSNVLHFSFDPLPVATALGADTTLCAGTVLRLEVQSAGSTYIWSDGSTQNELLVDQVGTYKVKVFRNNCFIEDSIYIDYVNPLSLELGQDTSICMNEGFVLSTAITNPSARFNWSNGAKTSEIKVYNAGWYVVEVSYYSCPLKTDSILISELVANSFIPNLVTKNDDGMNEYFEIQNVFPKTNVDVYNSWGDLVYSSSNYNNDWPAAGTEAGVYFYYVSNKDATCINDQKGWVHVVR